MYIVAPPDAAKVNFVDPCWGRLSQDLYSGEPAAFVGVQQAHDHHARWRGGTRVVQDHEVVAAEIAAPG